MSRRGDPVSGQEITVSQAENLLDSEGERFTRVDGVVGVGVAIRQHRVQFVISLDPSANVDRDQFPSKIGEGSSRELDVFVEEIAYQRLCSCEESEGGTCPAAWDNLPSDFGTDDDYLWAKTLRFLKTPIGVITAVCVVVFGGTTAYLLA